MTRLLPLLLVFIFGFIQSKSQPAWDYYKVIEEEHTNIVMVYFDFLDVLGEENWAAAQIKLEELTSIAKKAIDKVSALGKFNEQSYLNDAAKSLFIFYQASFSKDYQEVLNLLKKKDYQDTDDERIQLLQEKYSLDEMELIEKLSLAQEKFLKENNLNDDGTTVEVEVTPEEKK